MFRRGAGSAGAQTCRMFAALGERPPVRGCDPLCAGEPTPAALAFRRWPRFYHRRPAGWEQNRRSLFRPASAKRACEYKPARAGQVRAGSGLPAPRTAEKKAAEIEIKMCVAHNNDDGEKCANSFECTSWTRPIGGRAEEPRARPSVGRARHRAQARPKGAGASSSSPARLPGRRKLVQEQITILMSS